MASSTSDELRSFHAFLGQKLEESGPESPSPEEALELWRMECPGVEEAAETVRALREALHDMRAGDSGRPAREVIAELRRKFRLPEAP